MTIDEKNKLLEKDFSTLWRELWGDFYGVQYRSEEKTAKDKFNQLKDGILMFDDTFFSLKTLIDSSTTQWEEPEWDFQKTKKLSRI